MNIGHCVTGVAGREAGLGPGGVRERLAALRPGGVALAARRRAVQQRGRLLPHLHHDQGPRRAQRSRLLGAALHPQVHVSHRRRVSRLGKPGAN